MSVGVVSNRLDGGGLPTAWSPVEEEAHGVRNPALLVPILVISEEVQPLNYLLLLRVEQIGEGSS